MIRKSGGYYTTALRSVGVAKRVDIVLTGRAILALQIHSISHSRVVWTDCPAPDTIGNVMPAEGGATSP